MRVNAVFGWIRAVYVMGYYGEMAAQSWAADKLTTTTMQVRRDIII